LAKILREELAYRKRKRDRKSDPETIRRNVEICDAFHKEGNKKKLARRFGVTDRYIRQVIKEESHWREQAKQLDRK